MSTPNAKGKTQKKNRSLFCSRRKKRVYKTQTPISADCKSSLDKETDKGSWFAQQSQWPDELEATSAESPTCASKKKLESSKQAFRNENAVLITENDSEFELSCGSDSSDLETEDKEAYDSDLPFIQPSGNYIVNPENIEELLSNSAVCKVCHSPLQILEKAGTKHGLGAQWNIYCMNETCESRQFDQSLPISPKTGNMYEINRASVLGFRAIGKGRSAAGSV